MGLETGVYADERHTPWGYFRFCAEYYSIEMKQFEEFFLRWKSSTE